MKMLGLQRLKALASDSYIFHLQSTLVHYFKNSQWVEKDEVIPRVCQVECDAISSFQLRLGLPARCPMMQIECQ